jgi:hypothetical protein
MTMATLAARIRADVVWFFDAQLYVAAARAWLAGADPWRVTMGGDGFAAPPPTLLVLAPFTVPGGELLLVGTVIVGAIATIRVLRLPWWWLLFPPLVEAVVSGNLQTWLIPLILWPGGPIAVLAKVYAAVPLALLGRWRALVITAIALVVTIPLLPWGLFVADLPLVLEYYRDQAKYALPIWLVLVLTPLALLALWRIGRERAAWMAVPALVAQQWYYATFVMATGSWLAAAVSAVPIKGSALLALIALGLSTVAIRERSRTSTAR